MEMIVNCWLWPDHDWNDVISLYFWCDVITMIFRIWRHFSNSKLKFECIFIRRWHGHCFDVISILKFDFILIRRRRRYFFDVILILKLKFSEMTFCYRTVPTTIGKSWVVLWFDIDNRKTAVRPCSPNHRGVGEYMMRAGNINSVFGHHSWLLEYPILWHKMLKRPRQKNKEIAVYFHDKI